MPMPESTFLSGRYCRFTALDGSEGVARYFRHGSGPGPRMPYLHVQKWEDVDNPRAGQKPVMGEHEAQRFFASLPDPRYFDESPSC